MGLNTHNTHQAEKERNPETPTRFSYHSSTPDGVWWEGKAGVVDDSKVGCCTTTTNAGEGLASVVLSFAIVYEKGPDDGGLWEGGREAGRFNGTFSEAEKHG